MKCLSIHLTDLCNSECSFCVVASPLYSRDTVIYERVMEFLAEHADRGYHVVNLHGGEPTVHPRFLDLLGEIRDLGYAEVHLQTNGIKLYDEAFARRVAGLGVTKFIISLHGHRAEEQDSQTYTKGGFARTIEGIRNAKRSDVHVRTNTVITKQNLGSLADIARLACDLGVDHVNFSNMHPVGSARISRARTMPRIGELLASLYEAIDVVRDHERVVTLEGFPYCVIEGEGRELLHLNNEYRQIRMLMREHVIDDYDDFMSDDMRTFAEACEGCAVRDVCGGVYPEYAEYYGLDELRRIREPAGPLKELILARSWPVA